MAEWLATRLAAQEEQIRLLIKEVSSLQDGLSNGLDAAGITAVTPELEILQAENEKLKYRLLHLRRGLQAELKLEEEAEAPRKKRQGAKEATAPERNANKHQQINGVGVDTIKDIFSHLNSIGPPPWSTKTVSKNRSHIVLLL